LDRIRILISDVPGMLRDIIEEILDAQKDMIVVGDVSGDVALAEAAARTRADFVIRGQGHDDPEVEALLAARPGLKVLSVEGDGRLSYLSELRPRVSPLGELSPQTLLDSIRAAYVAET
jgi:DNA-binding NarL/FixJ family response regulator